MEEIGLWVGLILTLMVYSYIIADTFLYRLAVYIFVGLTAGYVSILTVESVLLPWFDRTIGSGDTFNVGLGFLPVLLATLLLLKNARVPWLARLGNLGIAVIVGVGAAVAVAGALTGTLIPLAELTINEGQGEALDAVLIFIGVASSLIYFTYLARRDPDGEVRRPRSLAAISVVGQGFIVVTLGALYAGAILTSLTIFSERISYVLGQF